MDYYIHKRNARRQAVSGIVFGIAIVLLLLVAGHIETNDIKRTQSQGAYHAN